MSQSLNRAWMVATFAQILAQTEAGSFVPVNSSYPEIIDLTERKYVKTNKKLHNKDGEVAYVAVKGANVVDLLTDLGYTAADREELSTIISSELIDAMTQAQAPQTENTAASAQPAVPTAPTPAATAAPVAPAVPAMPVATEQAVPATAVPTAADVAANIPAAPTLGGETLTQPATAAVAQQQTPEGVESAENNTIDFDVDFTAAAGKPVSKTINYDALVQAKLAHPESKPSLHIAGKKSKDISVPVKKQAEYYEKANGITFRVRTVGESDPKGAGVRIFALTVEEAPERRKFGGAK